MDMEENARGANPILTSLAGLETELAKRHKEAPAEHSQNGFAPEARTSGLKAVLSYQHKLFLQGPSYFFFAHFDADEELVVGQIGAIVETRPPFQKAQAKNICDRKAYQWPAGQAADDRLQGLVALGAVP
jgi:hypothetical protein